MEPKIPRKGRPLKFGYKTMVPTESIEMLFNLILNGYRPISILPRIFLGRFRKPKKCF